MIDLFKIIQKSFVRLRTAAMNPFRRVVRRVQQLFNVNLITAKLITPINKKIREILNVKPKDREDYFSVGIFWISRKLIYFLILAGCAAVFIYFNWFAPSVDDMTVSTNVITTTYYNYDDLDLSEFSGKANIRASNGEVVYTGDIAAGVCTGVGTLWNQDGVLVYEGAFENNTFAGEGTLYYANGKTKYTGGFANNNYEGTGIAYRQDGSMEYEGEFANGNFSGEGILYDETGAMEYVGNFENGKFSGAGASYYANGVKKYEGEFAFGNEQGLGTLYSSTGKKLFTGQFIRGQIQYESLLDISMEEILAMCAETPKIYYSKDTAVFLFENIGLALETNCVVDLQKNTTGGGGDAEWFLPGDEDQEILDTPNQGSTGTTNSSGSDSEEGNSDTSETSQDTGSNSTAVDAEALGLPTISTASSYSAYYFLETGEWVRESDLDYSQISVTGLVVLNTEISTEFLEDETPIDNNGEVGLLECVAIDILREKEPTLFGNIEFTESARNSSYVRINGIDASKAIYTQTYEVDNVRYNLCHEVDDYENWKFITMETY